MENNLIAESEMCLKARLFIKLCFISFAILPISGLFFTSRIVKT